MMELHPEVAQHVSSLEAGLEQYAQLHAVTPPAGLKDKVLMGIRQEKAAGPSSAATLPPPAEGPILQRPAMWKRWAVAASVLLLLSLGLNIFYGTRMAQQQADNTAIKTQQEELKTANAVIQEQLALAERNIQLLSDPDLKAITMAGVNHHDGLKAVLYWNKADGNTYLGKTDLPQLPVGKIYQLWAIVDGKPVDLGLYEPAKAIAPQKMKAVIKGQVQAFAITLEKAGGSPAPTMDQMYVMGASS